MILRYLFALTLLVWPAVAAAQSSPTKVPVLDTYCGSGFTTMINENRDIIDAADTAADNATVVEHTRQTIEAASRCITHNEASLPVYVKIILRNVMLAAMAFEMNASKTDRQIALQLIASEERIAMDQCAEPTLTQPGEPYDTARQRVKFVLDRDEKVLQYSGMPIEDVRWQLRNCATVLGTANHF